MRTMPGRSAASEPNAGSTSHSRRSAARLPDIRGHARLSLMRDIAIGEKSDAVMCRTYGLTARELPRFAAEFADDIADIAQAIQRTGDAATAGLWITRRQLRLAEMQSDIDDINAAISAMRENGGELIVTFALAKSYQGLLRSKLGILRAAAEEIDGPRRNVEPDEVNAVHYIIEADDFTGNLT